MNASSPSIRNASKPSIPETQEIPMTASGSAYKWSVLRAGLVAWARYAKVQEGAAWVSARTILARLQPAFALAASGDSTLVEENPSLTGLLQVRSSIAKKGAATKRNNQKKKAAGEPEYSGAVGKSRKKQDEREALAAQQAATAPSSVTGTAAAAPTLGHPPQ